MKRIPYGISNFEVLREKNYLYVDEYDNFANELITGGKQNTYNSILHGEGFVKVFYKALKDATKDIYTVNLS